MAEILVVGLNPAWQRILTFPQLKLGKVNRVEQVTLMAAGKGFNTAKALRKMGHQVTLLQILAGDNGQKCLNACAALGIQSHHVWAEGNTRVCSTLLTPTGDATELIEPFHVENPAIETQLQALLHAPKKWDGLVICGTYPAGISSSIYENILQQAKANLVVWDSIMGLSPNLLPKISWVKINAEEWTRLKLAETILGFKNPQPSFLVTSGNNEAMVRHSKTADGMYSIPTLESVRNSIGAGDATTAGLLDGLLGGLSEEEAIRHALAVGSASCLTDFPAEWNSEVAASFKPAIQRHT